MPKQVSSAARIAVARVYDERGMDPRGRVLVDRLWPRGLAKADAPFELWAKEVAPSSELRQWYGHQDSRFDEFARRYRHELTVPSAAEWLEQLRTMASSSSGLVLLTATKDLEQSHVTVLRSVLTGA
jgi:uncharacterized protein YeaO (DUF488 family)